MMFVQGIIPIASVTQAALNLVTVAETSINLSVVEV